MKPPLDLMVAAVVLCAAVMAGPQARAVAKTRKETPKAVKPAKTKDTPKPAKKKSSGKRIASFADNAKKLKALELTEPQQQSLKDAQAAREGALEKWSQANARSLGVAAEQAAKAKGKSSSGPRKRLDALKRKYEQGRQRIAAQHERKMFAILTPAQRGQWNAPVLAADVTKEFSSVKLDAEQKQKVLDLCRPGGKRLLDPAVAGKNAAVVKLLVGQTYTQVLTAEQRKTYNAKKRSAQTKSRTTRTTKSKRK